MQMKFTMPAPRFASDLRVGDAVVRDGQVIATVTEIGTRIFTGRACANYVYVWAELVPEAAEEVELGGSLEDAARAMANRR